MITDRIGSPAEFSRRILLADQDGRGWSGESSRVGVLAVDDQAYFRGVMRDVIEATDGFELVGEAASGEAAIEVVERLSPNLVILDKRMPGIGGIEACRVLTETHPEIVLLITSVEEPHATAFADCRATFIRKTQLSPRLLRELWQERRIPA